MKILHTLALAAALLGASAAVYAGDGDKAPAGECPAGGKAAGGCCADKGGKVVELKTAELAKMVAEKKATIVDVNPAERYEKGHVPGAKNAKFDAITEKDLPTDKNAQLVFYCASQKCGACEVAAKKAVELGYKNVAVYRPGIAGWETEKQAIETGKAKTNPS